jgi:hypothetical protein
VVEIPIYQFMPNGSKLDCAAVARWRHERGKFGTAKSLNFKGSGEMKWPQRGC